MANVTKIKFQYFKPLKKGTTEHTGGGLRRAGAGGAGRAGHPREGPRRRGRPGEQGAGRRRGRGGGAGEGTGRGLQDAPLPPRPAATPGLPGGRALSAAPGRPPPRSPGPRCRRAAAGRGIPEIPPRPPPPPGPHAPAAASPGTSFSPGSTREKPQRANERAPSS
ncbi:unnamed protein product [Nyctereutes procyonoides]|uniref:(raccoon dog) hypothetical protein n=1 Tax=Nyctereutes procyonoides TaxID=34880 RepID=A0A811ZLW6_NYCPR|nr:unnamed protein product [Nyctereutes procyonoides]